MFRQIQYALLICLFFGFRNLTLKKLNKLFSSGKQLVQSAKNKVLRTNQYSWSLWRQKHNNIAIVIKNIEEKKRIQNFGG